jgi:hypothetical protein
MGLPATSDIDDFGVRYWAGGVGIIPTPGTGRICSLLGLERMLDSIEGLGLGCRGPSGPIAIAGRGGVPPGMAFGRGGGLRDSSPVPGRLPGGSPRSGGGRLSRCSPSAVGGRRGGGLRSDSAVTGRFGGGGRLSSLSGSGLRSPGGGVGAIPRGRGDLGGCIGSGDRGA